MIISLLISITSMLLATFVYKKYRSDIKKLRRTLAETGHGEGLARGPLPSGNEGGEAGCESESILFDLSPSNRLLPRDYPTGSAYIKQPIAEAFAQVIGYLHASPVGGDIGEFGVGSGWTSTQLARIQRDIPEFHVLTAPRKLHLFDSFEGLPEVTAAADLANPLVSSGVWAKGTCNWDLPPELLKQALADENPALTVLIYKGWFADTLSKIPADTKFAMIHLDADIYQSTYEVLEYLLTKSMISQGAVILFDDWSCNASAPGLGPRAAWRDILEKYPFTFDDMGPYGLLGRYFVVTSLPRLGR